MPTKTTKKKTSTKKETKKYFEAVGKRKTAIARVRLFEKGKGNLTVNNKDFKEYFPTTELRKIATESLEKMECLGKFDISVKATGSGVHSQAEAVRHGIARALVKFDGEFRKKLRKAGLLTRDPRQRERKKFGLRRARRARQWRKR